MSLFLNTTEPVEMIQHRYKIFTLKCFSSKDTTITVLYDPIAKVIHWRCAYGGGLYTISQKSYRCTDIQARGHRYLRDLQGYTSYQHFRSREGMWGVTKIAEILIAAFVDEGCPLVKTQHFQDAEMEDIFRHFTERHRTLERTAVFKEELVAAI